jgi:hypothetical protein
MPKNEKLVSALQQPPGQRVSPGIYRNARGQNVRWNPGQPTQPQQQVPQDLMNKTRDLAKQIPTMPTQPYQRPDAGTVHTMENRYAETGMGGAGGMYNNMMPYGQNMQPNLGSIDPGFFNNQMPPMQQEQAPGERVSPGMYRTPSGQITRWNPGQNNNTGSVFNGSQFPQQPTPMPRGGYNWGQVSGGAQQPMPIPAAFQGVGYKR